MTIEEMDSVIQAFCGSDCEKCEIHELCYSIGGYFGGYEDVCAKAYEIIKNLSKDEPDNVNHPAHYETGKFECIDVMVETQGEEAVKAFCLCAAFKYLYRHNRKNGLEDIKKARWYLDKYVELEGEADG